jgi:uncharacterized delta-60 repeat protein
LLKAFLQELEDKETMKTFIALFLLATHWSNLQAQDNVQEAWVRHYGSGLVPGTDYVTAIAADKSGNVYVTGYTPTVPFGYDYTTVKYDATGKKVWSAKYNGPGNGDDQPVAMTLDESGNVYVTGSSYVSNSDVDYATVKYNSAGVQQWASHYRSVEQVLDKPEALAIGRNGNVYVTGVSHDALTGETGDYVTIKYNSTGEEQWVQRYNGPANRDDHAIAIAVDAFDYIYVTGSSRSGSAGSNISDYATIKYDSAGLVQWIARFNNSGYSSDQPAALAVDETGNVFVTGTIGFVSHGAYATVKYNADGVQQWVARYRRSPQNFAVALALDGLGNVYVTGRSGLDLYDFATVKYNADGVQQWEALYDGSLNSNEEVSDLAVDAAGNVYVTGKTGYFENGFATIKYTAEGREAWVDSVSGLDLIGNPDTRVRLALDDYGNVHVACSLYFRRDLQGTIPHDLDYTTVKYDPNGVEQWHVRYDESRAAFDQATAFAVGASGNIHVTGASLDSNTIGEYATIKYNSAGVKQWVSRFGGQTNGSEVSKALALDASGNIYVTGSSHRSESSSYDFVTLKYDSQGVSQWQVSYDASPVGEDKPTAIAVDKLGNVHVTGKSGSSYVTVKYNSAGIRQWDVRYAANDPKTDKPTDLALDAMGNVYVAGNAAKPFRNRPRLCNRQVQFFGRGAMGRPLQFASLWR